MVVTAFSKSVQLPEGCGIDFECGDPAGPEAESFCGGFGFRLLPETKRMAIPLNGK